MVSIELTDDQLTFVRFVLEQVSIDGKSGTASLRLLADVLEIFGIDQPLPVAPNGVAEPVK